MTKIWQSSWVKWNLGSLKSTSFLSLKRKSYGQNFTSSSGQKVACSQINYPAKIYQFFTLSEMEMWPKALILNWPCFLQIMLVKPFMSLPLCLCTHKHTSQSEQERERKRERDIFSFYFLVLSVFQGKKKSLLHFILFSIFSSAV